MQGTVVCTYLLLIVSCALLKATQLFHELVLVTTAICRLIKLFLLLLV